MITILKWNKYYCLFFNFLAYKIILDLVQKFQRTINCTSRTKQVNDESNFHEL